MDNYEVQQYMIENRGGDKPWAVRDMFMQITLSDHATREEAVAACEELRNPAPQPQLINWLGPNF